MYLVRLLALRAFSREKADDELSQPSRRFRVDLVHEGLVVFGLPVGLGRGDLLVREGHQDLVYRVDERRKGKNMKINRKKNKNVLHISCPEKSAWIVSIYCNFKTRTGVFFSVNA